MDPNSAIHNIEYDRMEPPHGESHLDGCPLAVEEVDDDAVCICDELGQDAKAFYSEQRYDASKED